ncbi:MAG: hypothetical protein IJV77_03410 [Clostridia bacterium]|nr:hypothetical protein [Clostridia bacterium]
MKAKTKLKFSSTLVLFAFVVLFYGMMMYDQYQYTQIQIDDLTQKQEVFSSFKNSQKSKYKIVCQDGDEYIITKILMDEDVLNSLKEGDNLLLSVKDDEIIQLCINGQMIISLDDCHEIYSNHVKTSGWIAGGFLVLFVGVGLVFKIIDKVGTKKLQASYNNAMQQTEGNVRDFVVDVDIYRSTKQSMVKTKGGYYCDFLTLVNSGNVTKGESVLKGVMDYICDDQFVLVFDRDEKNMAFAFYKKGEKLFFDTLFKDEGQPFKISSTLFWFFPYNARVEQEEQIAFSRALEYYVLTNGDILQMR